VDDTPPGWDRVVRLAQAMGMVSVQADCALDEALRLMNDRAFIHHCKVDDIAIGVLDRTIRFGPWETESD
jgi:hypothetical protein